MISFFIFDETSIIQIEPKILVVFFTAIFINNKSNSFIDKVSSNKLLTVVGVSSYTIYLLHYPLYNFYKHYLEINFKEISAIEKIVLMVIILLVSSFIYNNFEKKFIENFNKKRQIYLFILFSFNVFFIVLFLNTNFLRDSQYSKFSSIPKRSTDIQFKKNLNHTKITQDVTIEIFWIDVISKQIKNLKK